MRHKATSDADMLTKLMFRLLPAQILLAMTGLVNSLVSGFFASNYVGVTAMSAVGLFGPLNMLLTAISLMLVSGSAIMCGRYIGQDEQEKLQNNFSLNLILTVFIAAAFTLLLFALGAFDLTGFFTQDPDVKPLFNRYLVGQAIGVIPLFVGNLLTAFLAIMNERKRTIAASLVYIAANVILNYLFVKVLKMEAFGLALAASLGLWVFMAVQVPYYLSGRSRIKLRLKGLDWKESAAIIRIGFPGAASNAYQTVRGLIVNHLLTVFVGSVGISAFAAADTLLKLFWAVPVGMVAVSRLMISVSIGEEDRQTLADTMRVMFRRFVPLMGAISALIIIFAEPLTRLYFRDPSEAVYMMTVWGLRILPLCMPLSIICMHFVCYAQASGKQGLVHLLSLADGVLCVAGFTALLIRFTGMNSIYIANVLNGVVTTLIIIGYACIKNRRLPGNMEDLMVIPDSFGVPEEERLDLSVRNMEEVVSISERVYDFCLTKGIDKRRATLSGLALEEMAGNVVLHGFTKDRRRHSVDVRVVHKDDDVILRIKDDCRAFDPGERRKIAEGMDPSAKIGIRMIFELAQDIRYQNILGLNVLTIRIGHKNDAKMPAM